MLFADLTDTDFQFNCDFAGDAVDYWDYDFQASVHDQHYYRSLSNSEIETLRDNCKRILEVTQMCQGGS